MGAHSHTSSSDRGQGEGGRWLHGVDRAVQSRAPRIPGLHYTMFLLCCDSGSCAMWQKIRKTLAPYNYYLIYQTSVHSKVTMVTIVLFLWTHFHVVGVGFSCSLLYSPGFLQDLKSSPLPYSRHFIDIWVYVRIFSFFLISFFVCSFERTTLSNYCHSFFSPSFYLNSN